MVNERYGIAIAETLHYLKGISQDDIDKIPNKFMNFLKDNATEFYKCEFDYTKPLNELKLKNETRGLIAMICLNYLCETEEQKNNFREHLNENEKQHQEELRKKYNLDDIFKNKAQPIIQQSQPVQQEMALTEIKEGIFNKFIKKLKNIFRIK